MIATLLKPNGRADRTIDRCDRQAALTRAKTIPVVGGVGREDHSASPGETSRSKRGTHPATPPAAFPDQSKGACHEELSDTNSPQTASEGKPEQGGLPTRDYEREIRDLVEATVLVHIQDGQHFTARRLIKSAEFIINGRSPGTAPPRCLGCWTPMKDDGTGTIRMCDRCVESRGVMELRARLAIGMPEIERAIGGAK